MLDQATAAETWFPLFALVLVGASWLIHRFRRDVHAMTWQETLSNISIFIVWRFLFFAGGVALQLWVFTYLASLIPWKLPANGWSFALAVLAADFCYYWRHRYEHEINVLWCEHAVHHSSDEYNLSTSLRLPWLGSYMNWAFLLPMLLLGLSGKQIILGMQVVLAYQYLVHTELVGKLGILEWIFNTPSHHRAHHGRNEIYLDKNYGGILIIWDRVFGTFQEESESVEYGLVHPMKSKNPLVVNFHVWKDLFAMMRSLPSLQDKLKLMIIAPAVTEAFVRERSTSTAAK